MTSNSDKVRALNTSEISKFMSGQLPERLHYQLAHLFRPAKHGLLRKAEALASPASGAFFPGGHPPALGQHDKAHRFPPRACQKAQQSRR